MTEQMRSDRLGETRLLAIPGERPPNIGLLEPGVASAADKQRRVIVVSGFEVLLQPARGTLREEYYPFFATLADDFRFPGAEINLLLVERQQFADAHGTPEERLHERSKPQPVCAWLSSGGGKRNGTHEPGHFLGRQKDYFAARALRHSDCLRIEREPMLVLPAIAKQTLECRQDADLAADAMVLGEHPGLEKQYVVAAVRIHRTVTEHQDDLPQAIAIFRQ